MNQFLEILWLSFLLVLAFLLSFIILLVIGSFILSLLALASFCLVLSSPFLMVLYAVEAVVRAANRGKNNATE